MMGLGREVQVAVDWADRFLCLGTTVLPRSVTQGHDWARASEAPTVWEGGLQRLQRLFQRFTLQRGGELTAGVFRLSRLAQNRRGVGHRPPACAVTPSGNPLTPLDHLSTTAPVHLPTAVEGQLNPATTSSCAENSARLSAHAAMRVGGRRNTVAMHQQPAKWS